MEINDYDEIIGVIPTASVVEGRFGYLTTHDWTNDWGSDEDLPGFAVPTTAALAKRARYVITWPVNNQKFPAVLSYPAVAFSLRQGFDRTTNLPASLTLYGTNPAAQEGLTIPSGYKSLAFKGGTITVPSGCYVWSAGFGNPGSPVGVCDTVTDGAGTEGKLKYIATYSADTCIGRVYHFDGTTGKLTVILD